MGPVTSATQFPWKAVEKLGYKPIFSRDFITESPLLFFNGLEESACASLQRSRVVVVVIVDASAAKIGVKRFAQRAVDTGQTRPHLPKGGEGNTTAPPVTDLGVSNVIVYLSKLQEPSKTSALTQGLWWFETTFGFWSSECCPEAELIKSYTCRSQSRIGGGQ